MVVVERLRDGVGLAGGGRLLGRCCHDGFPVELGASMTEESLLEVRDLSKSYRRRPVLRTLALVVKEGEAVAVIGPNGAGKSTFLGCITGDRIPDAGSIRVCGHDPFVDQSVVANWMGSVPETPFLYGELTIAETIRFVSRVRGMDREDAAGESARLLDLFGLAGAEDVLCRELSQGMGRKTAIVLALLHRPRLLILDEIFNGLDLPSADRLIAELDAHRARGGAFLLSSHNLSLLASVCDRGLLLAPDSWTNLDEEEWQRWKEAPALTPA
ncbi:MAG: ATP-binding cassette domain-containing protein [Gemmatimonas sp.]|nr:ATP-binding cassette domain-containing protein [Gemmatimonas sp.]